VNRDSGTANANRGWLRRLVGGDIVITLNQLYKVWLNPDEMETLGLQLNMSVFIKSFDSITATNHALKKLFRPHLVHDSRRILDGSVSDDSNLVSNFELSFYHVRDAA
jgi:hypothetical protein